MTTGARSTWQLWRVTPLLSQTTLQVSARSTSSTRFNARFAKAPVTGQVVRAGPGIFNHRGGSNQDVNLIAGKQRLPEQAQINSISTVRFGWLNQRLSQILQVGGPVRSATVDVTPYPQSIFNRQRRRALNTRRALYVEPAERFLFILEW